MSESDRRYDDARTYCKQIKMRFNEVPSLDLMRHDMVGQELVIAARDVIEALDELNRQYMMADYRQKIARNKESREDFERHLAALEKAGPRPLTK